MYTSKMLYYTLLQMDDAYIRLIDHLESMPNDMLETEIADHAFPSIRSHLTHLLMSGNRIMYMLGDRDEPKDDLEELRGIFQFRSAWQNLKRRAGGWLQGRSEKELDHFETFVWPSGRETRMPHGAMFMRMLFHMAHHKGQIVVQCRMLGFPAPNTDLQWVQPGGAAPIGAVDDASAAADSAEEE